MSFEIKVSIQKGGSKSQIQQQKLNDLIAEIEQQQQKLAQFQQAKDQLQQHAREKLLPLYTQLYVALFNQLEQLWQYLQNEEFTKSIIQVLENKIKFLCDYLKTSNSLSSKQQQVVAEINAYYEQQELLQLSKKTKKTKHEQAPCVNVQNDFEEDEPLEFDEDAFRLEHERAREAHKAKRQQKVEQAHKQATQSIKSVYLKIAAMIHPDREQDEAKKALKTQLFQQANDAYERQDLFYLLKMQMKVELNKNLNKKGLNEDQSKAYKLALENQLKQLNDEIETVVESLYWKKPKQQNKKALHNLNLDDVYKQIEQDVSDLKQQIKWEKERLKYMGRLSGLEMLLEQDIL